MVPHLPVFEIYTDGASRGNPGPAAYAYLFLSGGTAIFETSSFLGDATNNTAEYRAIIAALEKAREYTGGPVTVFSDSELVIRQITSQYRITKPHLAELRKAVGALEPQFSSVLFRNVPRDNPFIQRCDQLCNETLDAV